MTGESAAFGLLVGASRLFARRGGSAAQPPRAVVIPPASFGSLGDSAMLLVTAEQLRKRGVQYVDVMSGQTHPIATKFDRNIRSGRYLYRGSKMQLLTLIAQLGSYSHGLLIGADIIDGAYNVASASARLRVLAELSRLGKLATITGCSFNGNPNEASVAALRALPAGVEICARDPYSFARMEALLDRPIKQTADLAFLLAPDTAATQAKATLHWIAARRAAGDRIVGVNATYHHEESIRGFGDILRKLVGTLLTTGNSVVLIPHDFRGKRSDRVILAEAVADLPESDRQRVAMLEAESPGVVKAVLGDVDLIVTGRMHVVILGLGVGTPSVGLTRQDKFDGLYKLFDLEDSGLLVSPEMLNADAGVLEFATRNALTQLGSLRRQINSRIGAIQKLAEANFPPASQPS